MVCVVGRPVFMTVCLYWSPEDSRTTEFDAKQHNKIRNSDQGLPEKCLMH